MLASLQYQLLKTLFPPAPSDSGGDQYGGESKLGTLLGKEVLAGIRGKTVIDFGCGEGDEAIALARAGAKHVTGIDIRENVLRVAKRKAAAGSLSSICEFGTSAREPSEVIISIDAFEHFEDPAAILGIMETLLRPDGEVLISFGPTWYHPIGGHLFSVFPWAHLLFSETALIRWRSDFKTDGATRFGEVEGGLNQMTIHRFEQLIAKSPFTLQWLEAVPIRRLRLLHNRLTREFTTSVVRCRLVKRKPN